MRVTDLTNAEVSEGADKARFLDWLESQSFNPIGANKDDVNALLHRWIEHRRKILAPQ